MSFQQAGCRRVVADVGNEINRGWLPALVRRFLTPEARFQKRIRIVDSCGDVFSDAGANPAASTNRFNENGPSGPPFPPPPLPPRLHDSFRYRSPIAGSPHRVAPGPGECSAALCRGPDAPRSPGSPLPAAPYRQVRTERVSKDVNPRLRVRYRRYESPGQQFAMKLAHYPSPGDN